MSSVKKELVTSEEYLARERLATFKSEFYNGEIFAMSGGSARHSLIATNFTGEARSQLKNGPCQVYNSDLRVRVSATGLNTYPDATIVCGELEFVDERRDTLLNPTVLVEVLSPSTEIYDRGVKSNQYRQIESLHELILIAQDRLSVERFIRQPDGAWLFRDTTSIDGFVEIESGEFSIAMKEIYRNVNFELNN